MECARGHEQDVIGAHHAIARVHSGAFDDGEDVALYTFARDIGAVPAFAPGNLVDFVEKHDAGVFHAIDGGAGDLVHVDQALLLFLDQIFEGFVHLHLPLLAALPEYVGQHVLDVDVHLFDTLVRDDFEGREIAFPDLELHHSLVQFAFAQLLTQLFAGTRLRVAHFSRALDYHAAAA